MGVKVLKRILAIIPILLVVSIILFFLMNILPGDAAISMSGSESSQEHIEQTREKLGLNDPPVMRYLKWVGGIFRGDFGESLINNQPVIDKILARLPVTCELALLAMLVAVLIAIPAGIVSAVRRNSFFDTTASLFAMSGVAIPHFWLAMLLIMLFSLKLGWLPASGYVAFSENPIENLTRMIMPAIAIGVSFAATVMRQTRSAMLEVLDQDFVVTAKAKGLPGRIVIWKHAFRNSLIPVITVVSMQLGRLFGGAVICETIFVMPGLGREIIDSVFSRDYPVTMGLVMVVAFIVILINALVDVIYIFVDPRVSHGER